MTEFLIQQQKLLDRLNRAEENLRQAAKDKTRAEDQMEYWLKQINTINAQLEQYRVE